jgi:tRNA1Val (adenine37-N6)-methyltransferase
LSEETLDTLFGGRLKIAQPRHGYRFSIDAPILAHFAGPAAQEPIVDLGCGSGVVALILAFKFGAGRITAIELQPRLAGLAERNVRDNGLEGRIRVVEADLADLGTLPAASAASVVCNPPYRRLGTGRVNPRDEQALARHELRADLAQVAAAAARLLKNKGRLFIIYPAPRLAALFAALREHDLAPKRLRLVHSRQGEEAVLALAQALKGGGEGLKVEPPLFVYTPEGEYCPEVSSFFAAGP